MPPSGRLPHASIFCTDLILFTGMAATAVAYDNEPWWIVTSFSVPGGGVQKVALDDLVATDRLRRECEAFAIRNRISIEQQAVIRKPLALRGARLMTVRCVRSVGDPLRSPIVRSLEKNKDWLFQGALVAIPLALIGWVLRSRRGTSTG